MTLFDEFTYENRRSLQAPLFAVNFLIAAAATANLFYIIVKGARGRRNIATLITVASNSGMIFLTALRFASLHPGDQLLYGPITLNSIADIELSLAKFACAVRYQIVLRSD